MYRIIKESYKNYAETTDGYRLQVAKPFELLVNPVLYEQNKKDETALYKSLSDFLKHIESCEKCRVILEELRARDINGTLYGIIDNSELEEQHKILHMFLNLAYW